jgi:hypothetical protein
MRKKCWQREIRESFAKQWHIDFDEDIDLSKASAIVEQIDFDTDQDGAENLMNLTSCFIFLYLVNLNAILDELKKQLNNATN